MTNGVILSFHFFCLYNRATVEQAEGMLLLLPYLLSNPGSPLLQSEQLLLPAQPLAPLHVQIRLAHQLCKPLCLGYLPPPLSAWTNMQTDASSFHVTLFQHFRIQSKGQAHRVDLCHMCSPADITIYDSAIVRLTMR